MFTPSCGNRTTSRRTDGDLDSFVVSAGRARAGAGAHDHARPSAAAPQGTAAAGSGAAAAAFPGGSAGAVWCAVGRLPYENLGPAPASSATVIDALPAGVQFVSASDGGVFNATRREVRWALGDVAVGASDELVLKVRVARGTAPGTVLVNEAQFRAPLTVATPLGRAVTTTVT